MSEEQKQNVEDDHPDELLEHKLDKSKSAEEIASLISQQQQISFAKSNENLLVSSFVSFFDPLIQNLDSNVQALRLSQCELSNQIKFLMNPLFWAPEISKIYEEEKKKLDLDEYTRKLVQTKKKLSTIQATIIAVQERLNRIYLYIQKDPYLKQYRLQQEQQQAPKEPTSEQSN